MPEGGRTRRGQARAAAIVNSIHDSSDRYKKSQGDSVVVEPGERSEWQIAGMSECAYTDNDTASGGGRVVCVWQRHFGSVAQVGEYASRFSSDTTCVDLSQG